MNAEYQHLQKKIDRVRQRFRWIVLARGLLGAMSGSLAVLTLSVLLVDHWNYSDSALTSVRVVSVIGMLILAGWLLVRPLLRRVGDLQFARYIEEQNPYLQERLISAVELGEKERKTGTAHPFAALLVQDALNRFRRIQVRSLFNPREPYLSGAGSLAIATVFCLLQFSGPSFFQYATLKLYANWLISDAPPLYRLVVTPGNVQLRKGSDQIVSAHLIGFDVSESEIYSRSEGSAIWQKERMQAGKGSNQFDFAFLDVNEGFRYYVRAGNLRSAEYSISVVDVPQVDRINLTYHFPSYTGLPDSKEENAGDISALKGTRVQIEAMSNADAAAARILLADGTALPMRKLTARVFRGDIAIEKDSSYRIELTDFRQQAGVASQEFLITSLEDQPPLISMVRPGRDQQVTKLEEVLTEIKADDDFGVNSLELHYTVNAKPEEVVQLFNLKTGEIPKTISGTHTFFLEELDLEPGDLVTYFASAADARRTTSSDIYFLEIRPFGKEYSQSQMAGGGGGAGNVGTVLSARQKEILAATWKLIRDRKDFSKLEYSQNLKLVAMQQEKLQQQTQSLSDRIQRRALVSRDVQIEKLSENLRKAIEAMTPAYQMLSREKPADAVNPEQTALQHVMRAEALFRQVQVAFGDSSGQRGQTNAQELENLFELELDKLKNQYETLQQRSSLQAGAEVDEALQKLKDLAQRQQQLNERAARADSSPSSSSSAREQRDLRQELEKLARQLERLSRETQNEDLLRASQGLQQAAQTVRSASNPSQGGESQNRGIQALSRMNDVRQRLENQRRTSASDNLKNLQASAEEAARLQEKIQGNIENLVRSSDSKRDEGAPSTTNPQRALNELSQKREILMDKYELKQRLGALEQNLYGAARMTADRQKMASRKLQSAGNSLRDDGVQEKVDLGGKLIARGFLDAAKPREQAIRQSIDNVRQKIAEAGQQLKDSPAESTQERLSKALNQTGDLVENLEALSKRVQQMQQAASGRSGTSDSSQKANRGQGATGANSESNRGSPASGNTGSEDFFGGGSHWGNPATNFGDRNPPAPNGNGLDARQFGKEYDLRLQEAQEIGKNLREHQDLKAQLSNMVERMKQMVSLKFLQDEGELNRLKASVIEGFRQLEVSLSQNLQILGAKENLHLAKDEEVPEAYRKQVEDYYKALSQR